jgi:hypothetical protein
MPGKESVECVETWKGEREGGREEGKDEDSSLTTIGLKRKGGREEGREEGKEGVPDN